MISQIPGQTALQWAIPFQEYLQNTYCLLGLVKHSLDRNVAVAETWKSITYPLHIHKGQHLEISEPSLNEGQASRCKNEI